MELSSPFSVESVHTALTRFPQLTKLTIDVDVLCHCVQHNKKAFGPVYLQETTHLQIQNAKKCGINPWLFPLRFTSLEYVLVIQSNLSSTDVNDLRQLLTPSLRTLKALGLINNTCASDVEELVLPDVEIHIAGCAFQ